VTLVSATHAYVSPAARAEEVAPSVGAVSEEAGDPCRRQLPVRAAQSRCGSDLILVSANCMSDVHFRYENDYAAERRTNHTVLITLEPLAAFWPAPISSAAMSLLSLTQWVPWVGLGPQPRFQSQ